MFFKGFTAANKAHVTWPAAMMLLTWLGSIEYSTQFANQFATQTFQRRTQHENLLPYIRGYSGLTFLTCAVVICVVW